jgi:hypothetical protein
MVNGGWAVGGEMAKTRALKPEEEVVVVWGIDTV